MGINITEIAQKVLDNNKNVANVFRKMYDLHYNPNPLDVPFEYIDENGNKVTTNIPNVTNFRKKLWDDVGGALGQFYKTFYVDAVNGDDNNDGSSAHPFKTLQKAVNSVPVGGYGNIILNSDVNLDFIKYVYNKILYFQLKGYKINVLNDSTSMLYGFYDVGNSIFIFDGGNLDGSTIVLPALQSDTSSKINHPALIKKPTNGHSFSQINLVYKCGVELNDDGTYGLIETSYSSCSYNIDTNGILTDNTGNNQTWADLVKFVVKDANGVPRNVVSNIVI
jgi:hypothetical protein